MDIFQFSQVDKISVEKHVYVLKKIKKVDNFWKIRVAEILSSETQENYNWKNIFLGF